MVVLRRHLPHFEHHITYPKIQHQIEFGDSYITKLYLAIWHIFYLASSVESPRQQERRHCGHNPQVELVFSAQLSDGRGGY